jgi:leader peptidase (prepilin peptidase)/N-methyltransferase
MLPFYAAVVFLFGCAVGSFLNVCAYRIPYEKSIFWPGSHCGHCFQPVRWYDNIPLVSYWLLRGRCRVCGARFSVRYFLVELGTGLAFAGLFYLEVVRNVLKIPVPLVNAGVVSLEGWLLFGYHAALISFLLVASLTDLDHMEIPLAVTVTGTLVGLVGSALLPWPYPDPANLVPPPPPPAPPGLAGQAMRHLPPGIYPWPVWFPLPEWLPPGSWQLGLATGLAGAVAGTVVLRAVRFLFGLGRGLEGLGLGDADLMMMAGSFLGWQPVLVSFFVGVAPGLVFGVAQLFRKGDRPLPFGPALAIGVVLTLLFWPVLGPFVRVYFFDSLMLTVFAVGGPVALLFLSFLLRLRGGPAPAEETAGKREG